MDELPLTEKITQFPNHVAVVPDGNRRWAEGRGLSRIEGHLAGAENIYHMVKCISEYPIKYLTLYGFSTENWHRPTEEVNGLFSILGEFINTHVSEIHNQNIQLRHLGRLQELPQSLQTVVNKAVRLTGNNTGLTLNIAFNYGGRVEILDAVRRILAAGIKPEEVDEELFNRYLYTADIPYVDLLIRTGDELRLSNFLIWQTAYSEYYFTNVLWPDFNQKEIDKALLAYSQRKRRFGGL
ncbi:polyprenyl diphosphate synthase [Chloroflexota bacterium]